VLAGQRRLSDADGEAIAGLVLAERTTGIEPA
jgi:hypothetical protein